MNEWLFLLIFIIGVLALVLEIFVTPGFGVAGISGIALVIWSVFLAATTGAQAIEALVLAIIVSIVGIFVAIKLLSKRKTWHKLVLGQKLSNEAGYITSKEDIEEYIGCIGIAITPLRPAGTAMINEIRVDVVTEGGFIPQNSRIKVTKVIGRRVVVELIQE